MAVRSLMFFMEPDECIAITREIADRFNLSAILARHGSKRTLELAGAPESLKVASSAPPDLVYLSLDRPDLQTIDPRHLRPIEWGWVQCEMPRRDGNLLLMSRVVAKSDWYDREQGRMIENPLSLTIFRKVAPYFRKRLKRPVWGHDMRYGGSACYRDVGYSERVAEWVRRGGELGQEGVANVRFTIDGPHDE